MVREQFERRLVASRDHSGFRIRGQWPHSRGRSRHPPPSTVWRGGRHPARSSSPIRTVRWNLALLLGLALAIAPVMLSPVSAAAAPDEAALIDGMRLRADFGLPADRETVSALLADPATDYSYGGPLTVPESAEMDRRVAEHEALEPLVVHINSHDDVFGGVYFEHGPKNQTLVIIEAAKVSAADHSRAVKLIQAGTQVRWESATFAGRELDAAAAKIMSMASRYSVTQVGVDTKQNRLIVLADRANEPVNLGDLVDVPTEVRYSAAPSLDPSACTSRLACTPYRGGIKITGPNQICTWGFIAKRLTTKYLLTAGHCGKVGQTFTHDGFVVNSPSIDFDVFDTAGSTFDADVLRGPLLSGPFLVSPYNRIYLSQEEPSRAITGYKAHIQQAVGNVVCFSGLSTGLRCGTIVNKNYATPGTRFDGVTKTFNFQIKTSAPGAAGDSGAPVFNGANAYGIAAFTDPGDGNKIFYGAMDKVLSWTGTTLCTTSGC